MVIFAGKRMDYSILTGAPLFHELGVQEIMQILTSVSHRIRKFPAGSLIAHSGETVKSLMLVIDGAVKGEMTDFSGKVIKIEEVHVPGALAAAFMFGNRNRFPVNVIALTDTELLIIDKPDFLRLLRQNDRILVNFLDIISNRSQFLSEKIKFLNFKTIRGKLAHFILQKSFPGKDEIILDMTQGSLAEFFGVARPSIARTIGEMEASGIIETKGKTVRIVDRDKLLGLTNE